MRMLRIVMFEPTRQLSHHRLRIYVVTGFKPSSWANERVFAAV